LLLHVIASQTASPLLLPPAAARCCCCCALLLLLPAAHCCCQISVRVTFDRGDVDAFVAEAIRLKESGTSNYETIVAGAGNIEIDFLRCCTGSG
jgi:hypothetical protein